MKEIDARGLTCPAPVLQTKAALQEEKPNGMRVVIDNAASQQNVQRILGSEGFLTRLERDGDDYLVIGTCDSERAEKPLFIFTKVIPKIGNDSISAILLTNRDSRLFLDLRNFCESWRIEDCPV